MVWWVEFLSNLFGTLGDVAPIVATILFFHLVVLRIALRRPTQLAVGTGFVIIGMVLFLLGLQMALFPLGESMARQLTSEQFVGSAETANWQSYMWVYLFAAAIGFATTIAEPSLLAVAIKANQVSGGVISVGGLRSSVAIGVALGLAVGTYRTVIGEPLQYFIIAGYAVVVVQTLFAPKDIIPLAYDSGGVTTSTVTVPLVTALGLGLAASVPGRDVLIDGFGLIAFASLFPMIAVMAYAQISAYLSRYSESGENHEV
ncbi:DUF1538 domain-containing protein [Aliagarivorans taiwanensis]|uniref:DUF1538 domain-containing protein n=1 Tax=Aliagarivorans taiwanensis TaxID=561966 RepID=UPI0004038E75|nr:DUF1538 domain-containing protein [Aliagarivorans taiwanensis]